MGDTLGHLQKYLQYILVKFTAFIILTPGMYIHFNGSSIPNLEARGTLLSTPRICT
jgi:hypothetical protein